MNIENISRALMLVYDTLMSDEESEQIIEKIDQAEDDAEIISGLKEAVVRLDSVNPAVAREVRELAEGFAF